MTTPALLEILSEAAVEIENAYGPENVVAKRVRRTMAELRDPQYWDKRAVNVPQINMVDYANRLLAGGTQ